MNKIKNIVNNNANKQIIIIKFRDIYQDKILSCKTNYY